MWKDNTTVTLLNDILTDGAQCSPFTIGNCFRSTTFMHFTFAHLTREAMRGNTVEYIAAYIAESGTRMGSRIPVMMIGE